MTDDRVYLTRDGLTRLDARIAAARGDFDAICKDNPAAAESGDSSVWHDNFAFEENQRQMQRLALRVRELERLRNRASIVEPPTTVPETASLGCWLLVEKDGESRWLLLVGWDDGDAEAGRLSYNAPLGRALVGQLAGEELEVTIGGEQRTVKLCSIALTRPEEARCVAA